MTPKKPSRGSSRRASETSGTPARTRYPTLTGLDTTEPTQLSDQVRSGLPFTSLDTLIDRSGLSRRDVLGVLQIPTRTLSRRKTEGRFNADESDRLLRVARVWARVLDLFDDDIDGARNWMHSPQSMFEGSSPLDFIRTEVGARAVEALVDRMEHGVVS